MNNIIRNAILNGLSTYAYVCLVATVMTYAEKIFKNTGETVLMPIAILLLFVLSAAITGFLVLGRPILWYLDGKKKEALHLLGYTLAVIFLAMIGTLIVILLA